MNESGVVNPILKILFINGIMQFSIKNVDIIYIYIYHFYYFYLSLIKMEYTNKFEIEG